MEEEMERRSSHCEDLISNRIYVDTISVQSVHLVQLSGTKFTKR